MSASTPPLAGKQPARRSPRRIWWIIGGALLAVIIAVAAVIVIPGVIQAQRVSAYNDLVALTNDEITATDSLREATDRTTVLYALQAQEAEEFLSVIEELAELSDHYFTDADRDSLAAVGVTLSDLLAGTELSDDEQAIATDAQNAIETEGYVWQTDFLNLDADAVTELIEGSQSDLIIPVADEEVTQALVEETEARLDAEVALRAEAEEALAAAADRADALIDAVTATLSPLTSAAESAPAQVAVVLGMYPNADAQAVEQLHDTSRIAVESVTAELFAYDEKASIPVVGDAPEDTATFAVTDAWRAVIISRHLNQFSSAVTAAWITDAGGVEEALGFNPFLPFF